MSIKESPQDILHLISQGKNEIAEEILRKLLSQDKRVFQAWHLLGLVQMKMGKIDQAITFISQAISLFPRFTAALCNLSTCYFRKKEYPMAIKWAKEALKIDTKFAQAWANLASAQLQLKRVDEAYISFKNGLQVSPDNFNLLNGMGFVMGLKNDHKTAIKYYEKTVNKNSLQFNIFLTASLIQIYRYQDALDHVDKVLSHSSDHLQALMAKGVIFYEIGRYQEALNIYQRAYSLDPNQSDIQTSMGILLLLLGEYQPGLKFFEHRKKIETFVTQEKKIYTPQWEGESIAGKRLLVCCEQGYGDTIHFLRYVPYLTSYQCKIIIYVQLDLHCLFKDLGFSLTCPEWDVPPHDLHVHLMSLPYIFHTDLSTIPPPISIPHVSRRPIKHRIGIAWKGNPKHGRDRIRSMDIRTFHPLFLIPDMEYISLQKGITTEEEKFLNTHKIKQPSLRTFADTLRLLETCERVICVDSALVHLAASMDIPTWVLLSYAPDWRWLLERSDSPWYPSVRLFRQTSINSWKEPIEKIKHLLLESPTVGLFQKN